ncbi:MAG: flagellar M-ring protein FliF C-terminal domain-containing protein [Planctomycetota bacterium]
MKETLRTLLDALRRTNGPTRWVIGAAVALLMGVSGLAVYKSANPHMELLYSALDQTQFSSATSALSAAGVRFDTTLPPGPYSIFVASGERFRALNAIHGTGALDSGEKGINTTSGSSEVFLGTAALAQLTHKRDWEDIEKQLEVFTWVARASVRSSATSGSSFRRTAPPTVSVIVTLRGSVRPSREQRQALASIVRAGANVPEENISIADQNGNSLFEGNRDEGLEAMLDFEQSYTDRETSRAQDFLDSLFGAGMSRVIVRGEWNHDRIESVDEAIQGTKLTLSTITSETSTPGEHAVGGPAGVQSVLGGGGSGNATPAADAPVSTTLDEEKRYAYPRKTTHLVQTRPVLERLTVSLYIDESLAAELVMAEELVKDVVGFDDTRGDHMTAVAIGLVGVADGIPIPAVVEPAPDPPNPLMRTLLERGVEILAAAVFLFVLLRSLKKSKVDAPAPGAGRGVEEASPEDGEDVDLGLLARRRVDQLIEDEPEKVGVLLSRWAADELELGGVPR